MKNVRETWKIEDIKKIISIELIRIENEKLQREKRDCLETIEVLERKVKRLQKNKIALENKLDGYMSHSNYALLEKKLNRLQKKLDVYKGYSKYKSYIDYIEKQLLEEAIGITKGD